MEEQEIIDKMIDLSNTACSLERLKDLFEAIFYEFKIRKSEKFKVLIFLKIDPPFYFIARDMFGVLFPRFRLVNVK